MASFIKEKNGTVTLVYDVYIDGKRNQKKKRGFKNTIAAKAAAKILEYKALNGDIDNENNITVSKLMSEFLKHKEGKIRPNTLKFYESLNRLYIDPMIGHYKLSEISRRPKLVQDFINKCVNIDQTKINKQLKEPAKLSPATIERIRATLRAAFSLGEFWGWINKNVAAGKKIEMPEQRDFEVVPYTEDQVITLIQYLIKSDILLPGIIAPSTGLRVGEVCALTREDIDFTYNVTYPKFTLTRIKDKESNKNVLTRTRTKTKRSKTPIAISSSLTNIILAHIEKQDEIKKAFGPAYDDRGFICAWADGRPYDPTWVSKKFQKIIKQIGLPKIRFHDLRHTFATILSNNGISDKLLQEMMRHSDRRMTDRYTHVDTDMQNRAANVIDFKIFQKLSTDESGNKSGNNISENIPTPQNETGSHKQKVHV